MKKYFLFFIALFLLCGCASRKVGNNAPLIGISSCTDGAAISLGGNYANAVFKAGGTPVILPLVKDRASADLLLSRLDGLIMSGGEDLDPSYYGEEVLNESVGINAVRDTSDFLLVQAALDCGKPIMGICRGHQLVNVALGGSLYQDIPAQIGTEHRQRVSGVPAHNVGLAPGSRLRMLLGDVDSVATNTHHHQAVKDPAPGIIVTARTADGVAEAFEGPGVFCVQFHPEALIAAGHDEFLPLFEAFVNDCR